LASKTLEEVIILFILSLFFLRYIDKDSFVIINVEKQGIPTIV